jgi:hypothetical protein
MRITRRLLVGALTLIPFGTRAERRDWKRDMIDANERLHDPRYRLWHFDGQYWRPVPFDDETHHLSVKTCER